MIFTKEEREKIENYIDFLHTYPNPCLNSCAEKGLANYCTGCTFKNVYERLKKEVELPSNLMNKYSEGYIYRKLQTLSLEEELKKASKNLDESTKQLLRIGKLAFGEDFEVENEAN